MTTAAIKKSKQRANPECREGEHERGRLRKRRKVQERFEAAESGGSAAESRTNA